MSDLSAIFSNDSQQRFSRSFRPDDFAIPPSKQTSIRPLQDESDIEEYEEIVQVTKKKKEKKRKVAEITPKLPIGDKETDDSSPDQDTNENISTTIIHDPKHNDKTLFVGNLPIKETVKSISKLFSEFGEVQSVRLRSVPIAGTKVDDAGNQNLVRKVCVNSDKFGTQKGSLNAYVVYVKSDSVRSAIMLANNRVVGDRHIRVDYSQPTLFDQKRTVFLGGLPLYIDEEELREFFAKVLPNGQTDIESVRLIRDPDTLIGKGIGYLLLSDKDAVMRALSLHQALFKKRWELRVTLCGKRTKRSEAAKNSEAGNDTTKLKKKDITPSSKKMKTTHEFTGGKRKGQNSENLVVGAMKRIKLKATLTRNQYLKKNNQKKDKPGKRGKKLGGVVKRAMKAAGVA